MTHRVVAGILALAALVCAQRRVDPRNTYFRVICVVPMTGQGTKDDPKRPLYAPKPSELAAAQAAAEEAGAAALKAGTPPPIRKDILAFTQEISDDGKYAIVEFVAQNRAAFQALFNDKANVLTLFEKGKQKKDDIEKELKKYKKDFDLDKFGVVMP